MMSVGCKHKCCKRTWLPLTLAYGRTIHKFQGQSAGPVNEGQAPNMFSVLICDPDDHKFEGNFMGLFYTAISRATTLGDDNGRGSAIYFAGSKFNQQRFRNIGKMKNSDQDYIPIQKRTNWVNHLQNNTKPIQPLSDRMKSTLNWASSATFHYDVLYQRIRQYTIANVQSRR